MTQAYKRGYQDGMDCQDNQNPYPLGTNYHKEYERGYNQACWEYQR